MSDILYDDHPESKDPLALQKNKQNTNKFNITIAALKLFFHTIITNIQAIVIARDGFLCAFVIDLFRQSS